MEKFLFASLLFFTLVILCGSLNIVHSENYYLDSKKGSDKISGTSPDKAWKSLEKLNQFTFQPGDSILFKAGGIWNGQFKPKGSGAIGNPIVVSKYGIGEKPILNGQGNPFTICLSNQQYWEISNLEITNFNPKDSLSFKRGIWIKAEDAGTVNHLKLINLDIHHVNGNVEPGDAANSKDNGGIFFQIIGSLIPTNFNGILIEQCHIYDVGRTGISLKSSWDDRSLNNNVNWFPSHNVIIRNNMFERTSGNALIWRVSHKPLVEYNVFHKCATDLSGNAMFFFNCDSALAQYNEAYLTVYAPGETDAAGFDADYRCKNTIYQYNYSHDNGQGAFVVCTNGQSSTAFQDGAVIRYNISQNDNREVFHLSGTLTNTKIYNNAIFLCPEKKKVKAIYHKSWGGYADGTQYYNNIFYVLGDSVIYDLGKSTNNKFDYNVFYGQHPESEPNDAHKFISDPQFINPGSGTTGINTVNGYKLKPGSPCIDSGKKIPDGVETDFWGNRLYRNEPDRGIHEY